jgi:phenylacetate-CoA ligase
MNWRKPLIRLLNPELMKNFEYVKSIQYKTPEDIAKIQETNLEKLLNHAYLHVPYYKKALKNYFGKRDFNKIPFLSKDIIKKEFDELKSDDLSKRKWEYNASGGSTGEPSKFIQDSSFINWRANKFFFFYMAGKDIGEKQIKLWGSEKDIFDGTIGLKAHLENFILNRKLLNAFMIKEEEYFKYVKEFNRYKPVNVWAYVDSAYEFARFIEKNRQKIHSPKSIIVTAGTLTEEVRKYIEKIFKTKVYNQYGSREVGDIACECGKQEGLHIFQHTHYVEVIDNKGKPVFEKPGEIVITLLNNYAMPLIRYKIGDTGILTKKKCSCGRGFMLLKKVTGRVTDHFKRKDGTVIHGEYFTHLFYFKDWIKKFKVIQKSYTLIEVLIVLNGVKNEKDIKEIESKIEFVMGKSCNVDFKFVDDIKPSASGKYLYTMSEVK